MLFGDWNLTMRNKSTFGNSRKTPQIVLCVGAVSMYWERFRVGSTKTRFSSG